MGKPIRWFVVLLVVAAVASCVAVDRSQPGSDDGMGAGDGVMLEAGAATQEIDGTRVTLTMAPWPPETLTETTLTVAVQRGEQAVTGSQPAFDLTMPGMTMPENRPVAAEQEAGTYLARTILTMGGRWQIDVTLDLPGGERTASFLLDANE